MDESLTRFVWEEIIGYAETHNQPGAFTALIGYEWSVAPQGNNLHRVVVMRDGGDEAKQVLPFPAYDSADLEDLWRWMAGYEEKTGGQVLAIPHNGNISNGVMFATETLSGAPIDRDYAQRRAKWDRGNWNGEVKTPEMLPNEYVRSALKIGLQMEQKLGVNPFKFGLVGATDSHTSLSTTREDHYFGKVSLMEPSATTRTRMTVRVFADLNFYRGKLQATRCHTA